MQVLLQISSGKSNVRNVRLKSDTVIGRSPECQLKVASNQISRRHCQIVIRDNIVAIKDLGSANGTFVNGRQIPPEVEIPLTPGTRVMLGPLQFTVEYELPGMPTPAAKPAKTPSKVLAAVPLAAVPPADVETNYDTITSPLPVIVPPIALPVPALPVSPAPAVSPIPAVVVARQVAPPEIVEPEGIPDFSSPFSSNLPAESPEFAPATVIASSPFRELPPEAFTPGTARDEEVDPGNFNFGIFASSSSGIIVESSAEIPIPAGLEAPITEPVKPPKKGLISMFGWGKKKAANPTPEPAANSPAEGIADAAVTNQPDPGVVDDAGETLTFEVPMEPESDAPQGDDPLQNFFNNFK